jgi:hypothetical protein
MNFCCSDDYTETGSFLTDDVDVYSAFQAYLVSSGNVFPSLEEFKNYYTNLVNNGLAQSLGNEIKHLPEMDCADFTETGVIVTDDVNIFSAYQAYLVGTGGNYPNTLSIFDNYYTNLVNMGLTQSLTFAIKHLPTKDADTFIISENGNVTKTGCSCTIIDTLDIENKILNVQFDVSSLTGTTNGNIKACEVVFDNIEFELGATANSDKISLGSPEITTNWGNLDELDANRINKYTNTMFDYGRRLNGDLPTNKVSNFGFVDLDGTGINATSNVNEVFEFNIPYNLIDEDTYRLAEVRVYDSSCEQNLFNIVQCIS